ncbi:tetratricopeptide repeat protein [Methylobacterium soli]|uniref:Sel1 repeat family protein n=1 Tax=Methylobacterium soli TaxID=553447 RepID=A0A6L3SSK5_9HYPH|nr:tetratricopeptide repeat protein [Methylobacterium soli]KAB1070532.1 hypothetical protein F6X53_30000 [Methylobacterium soli]GJE41997.1 hypothetical protein AEGHOMDF_1167 [Methylobacterium soli]
MRRNATPSFESFDPDVLEAARDVARRAGVPLETWISSVVPSEGKTAPRKPTAPKPTTSRPIVHKPSVQKRRRADEPAGLVTPPPSPARHPADPRPAPGVSQDAPALRTASPAPAPIDRFGETVEALMRRLDAIDRTIAEERTASQAAASQRISEIETRISGALDAGTAPVQKVAERLGDIERRMTELGEQLAAPRPLGRRGRPAVAEVRDAVSEIRQRQRELDGAAPEAGIVAAMREDLARRLEGAEAAAEPSSQITELQRETTRLRESIGGLATGHDVGALEQAMLSLASGVQRAQEPADLAAIAAPIELIRVQVERLADDVADNVHARVASDVERLATRVDTVLAGGSGAFADRDAVANLFRELDEIRRLVSALAGPERIQGLAQGLQAISAQIAQLQSGFGGEHSDMAELRPLLEEIRSGLQAPGARPLADQIQAMAAKVDALHHSAAQSGPTDSRAILGRIDALAAKVNPVGDLIGRLEHLGESLRQPTPPSGDLSAIQGMLHSLADKVDRVGARGGGDGLDALEKQVLALASRLESRSADPALASLERTMGDLVAQVSALRDEAPIAAVVERATRSAVTESLGGRAPEAQALGILKAGLADLRSDHAAADERLHATLSGVQSALDRLAARLGPETGPASPQAALLAQVQPPAPGARDDLEARLLASTGVQAPRARASRRPELPRVSVSPAAPAAEASRVSDELLEPGAGRPARERALATPETHEAGAEASADIKTSFIAAARRAAQAAQAEVASEASFAGERREERMSLRQAVATPALDGNGRVARLRAEIQRRRRPLLLGLAAIVLVLGALQAVSMRGESTSEPARAPMIAAPKAEAPARELPPSAGEAQATAPAPAPTASPPADPQTTQSIPGAGETAPTPGPQSSRSGVPSVGGMSALAGDLAGLPPGLAKLRQSVLEGDGAAIYELAGREADGRGLPRDLALAAKLYEKLAQAGYAPAQYKLAGHYEKGSGVLRDLGPAKLWYGRAAEQGHARSMHNLAVLYAENPAASGRPDYASAASWFRRAAEYGVRDSQYNLAVLYARGLGLTQDLMQSYAWFSAAAAQGDEDAGKKRDDVGSKMSPGDLAKARSITAAFRPHKVDPAVNEPPAAKDAGGGAMSLLGAPPPTSAPPGMTLPSRRS